MIAAALAEDEADADEASEDDAEGFDILVVLEGMSTHYHEHYADLLRLPWKVFCLKWASMLLYAAKEAVKREQEEIEREQARLGNG
jgi:hypothetical protein